MVFVEEVNFTQHRREIIINAENIKFCFEIEYHSTVVFILIKVNNYVQKLIIDNRIPCFEKRRSIEDTLHIIINNISVGRYV